MVQSPTSTAEHTAASSAASDEPVSADPKDVVVDGITLPKSVSRSIPVPSTPPSTWARWRLRMWAMMLRSVVIPGQWLGKLRLNTVPNVSVHQVEFPSREPGRTIRADIYKRTCPVVYSSDNSSSVTATTAPTPTNSDCPTPSAAFPSESTPETPRHGSLTPSPAPSGGRSRSTTDLFLPQPSRRTTASSLASAFQKGSRKNKEPSFTQLYIDSPFACPPPNDPMPVHVNLHGSGWVLPCHGNDVEFCSKIALSTGAIVIDMDYRKAPEDPFPAALEDVEDVIRRIYAAQDADESEELDKSSGDWEGTNFVPRNQKPLAAQVRDELDLKDGETIRNPNGKVSLSGFSSGGNLAIAACVLLNGCSLNHHYPCPMKFLTPSYPNRISAVIGVYCTVDMRKDAVDILAPDEEHEGGARLPQFIRTFFRSCYVSTDDYRDDPHVSPILAPLSCFPQHILLSCGTADSNYDGCQKWVELLNQQGHPDTSFISIKGVAHAFDKHPRPGSYAEKVSGKLYEQISNCLLRAQADTSLSSSPREKVSNDESSKGYQVDLTPEDFKED